MALSTKVASAVRSAARSPVALGGVRWNHGDDFFGGSQGGAPGGYGGGFGGGNRGGGMQQGGFGGPPGGFGGQQGGFGGQQGGYGGPPRGGFGGSYGGGMGGMRAPRPPMPEYPLPEEAPYRMFIRNLNYNATEDDIRSFFSGMEMDDVHIPKNEFGLSKGFCFVSFVNREDAEKALNEYNGKDMLGRAVGIKVGAPRAAPMGGGGSFGAQGGAPPRGDHDGF